VESIVSASPLSVTCDFLLNGLPWRSRFLSSYAGHNNPIEPVVNIARRYQVSHGRFQGFVSHPVLNRSDIEAGTKHSGRIRRAKCL